MPPLRLVVLGDVAGHPNSFTANVVERLQLPRKTVDRVLQELHLLGLLVVNKVPRGEDPEKIRWSYSLADCIDQTAIGTLRSRKAGQICHHPTDKASDTPLDPEEVSRCSCGQELYLLRPERKICERCRLDGREAS